MGIWDEVKSLFLSDDGDFLQVGEHHAEPRFSHKEIQEAMIKAGHAIKLDDGRVIGIRRLFKPKKK